MAEGTLGLSVLDPIEDTELLNFAKFAYQTCVSWFGLPPDVKWPYVIVSANSDACYRTSLMREYTITLCAHYEYSEQFKAAIAHEMYHRVTMRRESLARTPWVDELLAFTVSQRLLNISDLGEYARQRAAVSDNSAGFLDLSTLKSYRRKRTLFGFIRSNNNTYPKGFDESVTQLGVNLESLVGWECILKINKCSSWEEWLAFVPRESRGSTKTLLEI